MSTASFLIVSFCVAFVLSTSAAPIRCPSSPSEWCRNKQIAAACGVSRQCSSYVWNRANDDRVNFTIFYESLCADCRQYTTSQVWFAYQALADIVNFTFVPYGNAREVYRPETQLYQFYCQHGPDECYANLIHTCALALYPDIRQHIPFLYCMDSILGDVETVARQCAKNASLDYEKIATCTSSRQGNQLQHDNAVLTEQTKPVGAFVPFVSVNGNHTAEIQTLAQTNLIALLCSAYKGPNPPVRCKQTV